MLSLYTTRSEFLYMHITNLTCHWFLFFFSSPQLNVFDPCLQADLLACWSQWYGCCLLLALLWDPVDTKCKYFKIVHATSALSIAIRVFLHLPQGCLRLKLHQKNSQCNRSRSQHVLKHVRWEEEPCSNFHSNRPLAQPGHMIQNQPYWAVSYAVGHPKQMNFKPD